MLRKRMQNSMSYMFIMIPFVQLFEHFDMDGNGKIDSYEFVCALAMLSHSNLDVRIYLFYSDNIAKS